MLSAANATIVVQGYDRSGSYLWVLSAPDQPQPITEPDSTDPLPYPSGVVADANHGWWIGSADGLYLWSAHTGAILVSESLAAPVGACA